MILFFPAKKALPNLPPIYTEREKAATNSLLFSLPVITHKDAEPQNPKNAVGAYCIFRVKKSGLPKEPARQSVLLTQGVLGSG